MGPAIVVLAALAFSGGILFYSFRKAPDRQSTSADPTPAPTAAPVVTPAPQQSPAVAATTMKLFSETPLSVLVDKTQVADKQQGLIPINSLPDGEHSLELVVQGFRHNIKFSADEHGVTLPDPGAPSHCDTVVFYRRDGKWSAVSSIQDGEVTIDGQPVSGLPKADAVPLGDGAHNIAVKMAGKAVVAQDFQIVPSDRLLIWVRPLAPVFTVETNLEKFEVLVRGKVWASVRGLSPKGRPPGGS
jgi:hypothetical protein